jgi:hypothetical protein
MKFALKACLRIIARVLLPAPSADTPLGQSMAHQNFNMIFKDACVRAPVAGDDVEGKSGHKRMAVPVIQGRPDKPRVVEQNHHVDHTDSGTPHEAWQRLSGNRPRRRRQQIRAIGAVRTPALMSGRRPPRLLMPPCDPRPYQDYRLESLFRRIMINPDVDLHREVRPHQEQGHGKLFKESRQQRGPPSDRLYHRKRSTAPSRGDRNLPAENQSRRRARPRLTVSISLSPNQMVWRSVGTLMIEKIATLEDTSEYRIIAAEVGNRLTGSPSRIVRFGMPRYGRQQSLWKVLEAGLKAMNAVDLFDL